MTTPRDKPRTRARRAPAGSPESKLQAFADAQGPGTQWPAAVKRSVHPRLFQTEGECFAAITATRAADDWDSYGLLQAARLARLQALSEAEEFALMTEGLTTTSATGIGKASPRVAALALLNGQIRTVTAALGVSAPATDKRQLAASAAVAQQARAVLDKARSDSGDAASLLA